LGGFLFRMLSRHAPKRNERNVRGKLAHSLWKISIDKV
jgi:hypothetical protein